MLKKEITYDVYNPELDDVVEVSKTVRLLFNLKTLRAYEQETGRLFFEDYQKSFGSLKELLKNTSLNAANVDELDEDTQIDMLDIVADPKIHNFMVDLIPVMYAVVKDGVLVQNEQTYEEALSSDWLMSLVNIYNFMDIFGELSKFQEKTKGKGKKKGKK